MADIRINSLPSTATSFNTDDYIAIDGASGGTRKMLAATLPLTDVTLGGASGPSVKSSLSARAPRQGLVFDGTTGGSFTLTSAPSGSWSTEQTALIPTANPSSAIGLFAIGGTYSTDATIAMYISAGGALVVEQNTAAPSSFRTASISGFRSAYSGKTVRIATTVSSSTLTIYVNGVSASYSETTTGGSPPAWGATLGSATSYFGKLTASQYYFNSALGPLYIYNRALSASEVVALYEAGAPAGADYASGGANNTSLITGANSDFSSDTTYWSKAGSASIGGNQCTLPASGGTIYRNSLLTKGTKYRLSVSIVTNQTGGLYVQNYNDVGYGNITGTGTKTLEFVASGAGATTIALQNNTAGSIVIDDVTIVPIGLLLAPDAAQAGGGLVWYDTSGNAANITLPASGVSWNVPFAGYVTAPTTTNLTLAGGSSGASLVLGQGANAGGTFTNKGTGFFTFNGPNFSNPDTGGTVLIYSNDSAAIDKGGSLLFGGSYTGTTQTVFAGLAGRKENATAGNYAGYLQFYTGTQASALEEVARLTSTGNYLIGTTTDGGQKLQVSGTAAFTSTVTVASNFTISSNGFYAGGGTPGAGRLLYSSTAGTMLCGQAGSTYDLSLATSGGTTVLGIPTGTTDATFAGTVTPTGGIVGVTTNSNAAAGIVGQYVEAQVASGSAITLSTATAANITSISLTAGDWDVSSNGIFIPAGAPTLNLVAVGQTSSSATLPADVYRTQLSQPGNGFNSHLPVTTTRFSLASTTTIYLVAYAEFSGGTSLKAHGIISARRVR